MVFIEVFLLGATGTYPWLVVVVELNCCLFYLRFLSKILEREGLVGLIISLICSMGVLGEITSSSLLGFSESSLSLGGDLILLPRDLTILDSGI